MINIGAHRVTKITSQNMKSNGTLWKTITIAYEGFCGNTQKLEVTLWSESHVGWIPIEELPDDREQFIEDAAEAVEIFGEDELERFAEERKK